MSSEYKYPYLIVASTYILRAVEETFIGMKRCISEKLATTT